MHTSERVCTFLADREVAVRQAKSAKDLLTSNGYQPEIEIRNDTSNPMQKGSSIVLWAETDKDAIIGADAIGEIKKTAEEVGKEAAERLLKELGSNSTVDTHLADMIIPYMAGSV